MACKAKYTTHQRLFHWKVFWKRSCLNRHVNDNVSAWYIPLYSPNLIAWLVSSFLSEDLCLHVTIGHSVGTLAMAVRSSNSRRVGIETHFVPKNVSNSSSFELASCSASFRNSPACFDQNLCASYNLDSLGTRSIVSLSSENGSVHPLMHSSE